MKKNDLNALKTAALEELIRITGEKKGDRKSQSRQTEAKTYLEMTLKKIDMVEKLEMDTLRYLRDLEEYVTRLGKYGVILYREEKAEAPPVELPGVKATLKDAEKRAAKAKKGPKNNEQTPAEGKGA